MYIYIYIYLPKESSYKILRNAFYLTKNVPFVLEIFKFLYFSFYPTSTVDHSLICIDECS